MALRVLCLVQLDDRDDTAFDRDKISNFQGLHTQPSTRVDCAKVSCGAMIVLCDFYVIMSL